MKKIAFALLIATMLLASCTPTDNTSSAAGTIAPVAAPKIGTAAATALNGADVKEDKAAYGQADVTFCTVVLDDTGKITYVNFDGVQTKFEFSDKGALQTDLATAVKTKKELGAAYNMKQSSSIGKEWDEQVIAYEQWLIGKTMDEVAGMKVLEKDVPDVAELKSSVTISIAPYRDVLVKAAQNAK